MYLEPVRLLELVPTQLNHRRRGGGLTLVTDLKDRP